MKLLIKLLYSLGILKYKISFNEFLEYIEKITELGAEQIMKDDIKNKNLRDKGLCEIKIYLSILSINSFNNLPQDVIKKIGIHFRNHIIFSNINLTEDEEIRLLEERIPFHENNLSRIINNNESSKKYTEMLSMLFYSKPFVDIYDIKNPVDSFFKNIGSNKGFLEDVNDKIHIKNAIENIVPAYSKSLKNLQKFLKQ